MQFVPSRLSAGFGGSSFGGYAFYCSWRPSPLIRWFWLLIPASEEMLVYCWLLLHAYKIILLTGCQTLRGAALCSITHSLYQLLTGRILHTLGLTSLLLAHSLIFGFCTIEELKAGVLELCEREGTVGQKGPHSDSLFR